MSKNKLITISVKEDKIRDFKASCGDVPMAKKLKRFIDSTIDSSTPTPSPPKQYKDENGFLPPLEYEMVAHYEKERGWMIDHLIKVMGCIDGLSEHDIRAATLDELIIMEGYAKDVSAYIEIGEDYSHVERAYDPCNKVIHTGILDRHEFYAS